jgi:hypothetical protein
VRHGENEVRLQALHKFNKRAHLQNNVEKGEQAILMLGFGLIYA